MGSGTSCIKYLMFAFNFLIFLGGAALLGLGIWVAVNANSFSEVVSSDFRLINSAYIIIAVGGALLLIGFFGCCGAIKENKCLLGTFFTVILILFIVEIVGAVLAFVFYPQAEEEIKASMGKYSTDDDIKNGWDAIQTTLKCCGYDNATDWGLLPVYPTSCCEGTPTVCTALTSYDIGCKKVLQRYFWIIGGVGFGILIIELLAMIFACCLYRSADGGSGGYA